MKEYLKAYRPELTDIENDALAKVAGTAANACLNKESDALRTEIALAAGDFNDPYLNRLVASERGYLFNLVRMFLALR